MNLRNRLSNALCNIQKSHLLQHCCGASLRASCVLQLALVLPLIVAALDCRMLACCHGQCKLAGVAVARQFKRLNAAQVTEGHGRVLITAVGPHSEWGMIMDKVQGDSEEETPLQEKLGALVFTQSQVYDSAKPLSASEGALWLVAKHKARLATLAPHPAWQQLRLARKLCNAPVEVIWQTRCV